MSRSLDATDLPIPFAVSTGIIEQWTRLAKPGTWWTAAATIAIAHQARRASDGEAPEARGDLPEVVAEAAQVVPASPTTIRRAWVEELVASALSYEQYVELVGTVSVVVGIDSFHRGIGAALEPLPNPTKGEPSGEAPPKPLQLRDAWVPMPDRAWIMRALALVPAQTGAIEDVQSALYVTGPEFPVLDLKRGLDRTQMELVAARTSFLNECFY